MNHGRCKKLVREASTSLFLGKMKQLSKKETKNMLKVSKIKRRVPKKLKTEKDKRYCHLCGSEEIKGGWCTNETCAEYRKYEK